jgi:hypothetical protein
VLEDAVTVVVQQRQAIDDLGDGGGGGRHALAPSQHEIALTQAGYHARMAVRAAPFDLDVPRRS